MKLEIFLLLFSTVGVCLFGAAGARADPLLRPEPTGSIGGILRESGGKARPYTELELVPVGDAAKSPNMRLWSITDIRGRFLFADVPEGAYQLSINFGEIPTETTPYQTVFFPNTGNRSDARVFYIDSNSSVKGLDFVLPKSLPMIRLTGNVITEDWEPVRGAHVWLSDSEFISGSFGVVRTNSKGWFTTLVFLGREYRVSAQLESDSAVIAAGSTKLFQVGRIIKPVTIILKELKGSSVVPADKSVGSRFPGGIEQANAFEAL